MIKLSRPSPRLCFSLLLTFEKSMLVAKRARGLIRKRKPSSPIKKKRLSQLTVSLLSWQEQILSLLAGILGEPEKIVTTNNRIVQ